MATGLSDGYIYFLESDAVDNDDWIGDHAGDPDNADISGMAEGTEHCKIPLPKTWRKTFHTGIIVKDSGGGTSFDMRAATRGYSILPMGFVTSIANANLVEKFFMIDRHTSGASATFVEYYIVIRFGAGSYAEFKDASASGMKKYCPVRVIVGHSIWNESNPLVMTLKLNIRSVW